MENPLTVFYLHDLLSPNLRNRQIAADKLRGSGWKPTTRKEAALYQIASGHWRKARDIGHAAIPAFVDALHIPDIGLQLQAVRNLQKMGPITGQLPKEAQVLVDLVKYNHSEFVERFADRAGSCLIALAQIPDSKQRAAVSGNLFRINSDLSLDAIASVLGPRWFDIMIDSHQSESLVQAASLYPPIGGKIPFIANGVPIAAVEPANFAEQHCTKIHGYQDKQLLGDGYVHQLTVQGRLPDSFKYAAVGLILSSPYRNDWNKPFFETAWGKVAPLIHDGGAANKIVNRQWKGVLGRTDFIQRIVAVSRENGSNYPSSEEIFTDSFEKRRLWTEARAYQRLALALHARSDTLPDSPHATSTKDQLAGSWDYFRTEMDQLLEDYGAHKVVDTAWLLDDPRQLPGWFASRQEADYRSIRWRLVKLERTKMQNPSLRERAVRLLKASTNQVDEITGLSRFANNSSRPLN